MKELAVLIFFCISSSFTEDTLQLVHLVFRHGQRTPADTYPKDPYIKEKFSPYGWGALTNEGKNQQFEIGKDLRLRYDRFLGKAYTSDILEAWTTDSDRTKMSAALVLAGLFPPVEEQIWNKDLLWQPIPTSYQKLAEDKLLLVRGCPRYSEAVAEIIANQVAETIAKQKDLYDYLTEHTGKNVSDPDAVMDIFSTLKAEEEFGLKLPSWTNEIYPDEMAKVTAFSFIVNTYTDELKRLKGGPLLKKILNDSKKKMNDNSFQKKLYLYAGHDSTVANVLQALKVWDSQIPGYNILTLIELHKIEDDYKIKVFLKNSTHEPYLLTIPGCEEMCPMNKVLSLTTAVIPDNLNEECIAKKMDYKPPQDGGP
ncbi:venom acid phosphatase Acph-1 [Halyomorpha halys]|uniref:venom acid phosphatase Acph-1 n=1 Tax=Halyomorpha halys TaxID=286706 RepID=UPI0006D4E08F|nr:venom acid phosphatase Acph-1-like [Halyomorpha halys]